MQPGLAVSEPGRVENQQGQGAPAVASKPGRDQEFPPTGVSEADMAGFVQKGVGKRWIWQPGTFLYRVGTQVGRSQRICANAAFK